jgi:hypothetical protein
MNDERALRAGGGLMTLEVHPIVLQLVRRLFPYLPALSARSTSLGLVRIRTSHSGYRGRLSAVLV